MILRNPGELADLFRDGRARAGWSQAELAKRAGVSRQWISLVENGKTSVEFDLVIDTLREMGYHLTVGTTAPTATSWIDGGRHAAPPQRSHGPSTRTPLTRSGQPLKPRARRRQGHARGDASGRPDE